VPVFLTGSTDRHLLTGHKLKEFLMRSEETSPVGREIAQIIPLEPLSAPLPSLGNDLMMLAEQFLKSLDVKSSSRLAYR